MYTITETILTEAGEVIASGTTYAASKESTLKKLREISERNDAIGLVAGRTYTVEFCEPGETPMHLIGATV